MKKWYQIQALAERESEILIYEQIGKDYWDATGISGKEFVKELNALDVDKIVLRINSPGGNVFEGNVIYNALRAHSAEIEVHIDGIAASIASVIAMAGDTIMIPANGMLMIHDPSGGVWGTSVDLRKRADALDKIKVGIVSAYRQKTDMDDETLGEMMTEETWLTAEEAVEHGFADSVTDAVDAQANFKQLKDFRNTPERLIIHQFGTELNSVPQKTDIHAATPTKQPAGGNDMADTTDNKDINLDFIRAHHPAIAQALIDKGATAEQARIKGVMDMAKDNMTDAIQAMIFDGKSSEGDVAMAIVKAGPAQPPAKPQVSAAQAAANDLAADAAVIPNIDNQAPDGEADEAEMASFMDNIKAGSKQR